jgi:hypothetical protein
VRWIRESRQRLKDRLDPFRLGFIGGIGSVAVLTVSLLVMAWGWSLTDPSADLFRDLAALGAALFVAYSVAAGTTGPRLHKGSHQNWLGSSCGLGIGGLTGIAMSIGLAAYRDAGHAGALDVVGLCWIVANLTLLGVFVAMLPAISSSWRASDDD